MSTASPRQPPFYCPACGQKHRADVRALQGREGATAKVTCTRCETVMTLRFGSDGLPKCEADQPIGGAMSQPETQKSPVLAIAAAAVIAAVVSAGVAFALKPEAPSAPKDDPRIGVLEGQVQKLTQALEEAAVREKALQGNLTQLAATLDARVVSAEKTVANLGQTVSGIESGAAKLSASFLTIQKDHADHGGRIEANRVTGRQLDKRLKALEGN